MPIISGVVLYWPFTRRLNFGTISNPNQAASHGSTGIIYSA